LKGVVSAYSQLSTTTASPTMQYPPIHRIRIHTGADPVSPWTMITAEPNEARTEKVRMCPTECTSFSTVRLPRMNPRK
jgi:hypothetical protein